MTGRARNADARRALGAAGEEIAARALQDAGLVIVGRNWRCATGELDIIATDRAPDFTAGGAIATWLVAVEVRTRRGSDYGTALEAVDRRKQAKLREVTSAYVQFTGWTGPWRIDVVAVQMDARGRLQSVDHLRNAVFAE